MSIAQAFLSHCSEDSTLAVAWVRELENAGVPAWASFRDIAPGAHWDEAIETAIHRAVVVVVLATRASVLSRYVRAEVDFALSLNKTVVPLVFDDADLPLRWRALQAVAVRDGNAADAARLIAALLPRHAHDVLRIALSDGDDARARDVVLQNPHWLPGAGAGTAHVVQGVELWPGSPIDFMAVHFGSGGPGAVLTALCAPSAPAVRPDGELAPHMTELLDRLHEQVRFLTRPMPAEHPLAPCNLAEPDNPDPTPGPLRYWRVSVQVVAGRRRHYTGAGAEGRFRLMERMRQTLGTFNVMSYDRIVDHAVQHAAAQGFA